MTWKELVEIAKDYGYIEVNNRLVYRYGSDLEYCKNGDIEDGYNGTLAMNRKYEQMKIILKNIHDKEK